MICVRCKKETDTWSMSFMNTDEICLDCKEEERQHPRYQEAKDRELEEIEKGNYNYQGLFAGQKYPFEGVKNND